MDEFVPLKEIDKSGERINIYLSDGFTPKYSVHNIADKDVIKRARVIMQKRDLKKNDER